MSFLGLGISFLFTILIGGSVDPYEYGIFGMLAVIEIATQILTLGLNYNIIRGIAHGNPIENYWVDYSIGVLFYSFSVILILLLLNLIDIEITILEYWKEILLILIFNNISQFDIAICRGYNKFHIMTASLIISAATMGLYIFYLYVFQEQYSAIDLFYRRLVQVSSMAIVLHLYIRKKYSIKTGKFDVIKLQGKIQEGFAMWGTGYVGVLLTNIDRIFIANFFPLSVLGEYSMAKTLLMPFEKLINTYNYLDFSDKLTDLRSANIRDLVKIVKEYVRLRRLPIILLIIIAPIFVLVVNDQYLNEGYTNVIEWSLICIPVILIQVVVFVLRTLYISLKLEKVYLKSIVLALVLAISLNYIAVYIGIPYMIVVFSFLVYLIFIVFFLEGRLINKYIKH
jgi:O-antigen/teichoic acid export membrane protein